MKKRHILFASIFFCTFSAFLVLGCTRNSKNDESDETLTQLTTLLEDETISAQSRYAVINRIANLFYSQGRTDDMVLFLTE